MRKWTNDQSIHILMKKLFLSLFLLLPVIAVAQQANEAALADMFRSAFNYSSSILKFESKIYRAGDMTSKTDPTRGGRVEGTVKTGSIYKVINVTNPDYCAYTIWTKRGKVEVSCGEQEFPENAISYSARRLQYRGIVPGKKFKEDGAVYVPPCAMGDGESVSAVVTDVKISDKTMHILTFGNRPYSDTIYATRGGKVCLFPSEHKNSILVKHADETFALYFTISATMVKPGDMILPGQPIAISNGEGINVAFFYLDKEKMNAKEEPTGYPYCSFMPVLYSENGLVRWSEVGTYSFPFKEPSIDIITQDMSKSEMKKYLKAHKTK